MPTIENWLRHNDFAHVIRTEAVGGGSISLAQRLQLADGSSLFAKSLPQAPLAFYHAEAQGLDCMRQYTPLRIPKVVQATDDFILLEDLGEGSPGANYWQNLAEGLARLHAGHSRCFGFAADNFCGRTPQINTKTEDGFSFFAQYRILNLARQLEKSGALSTKDMTDLGYIAENLDRWIPQQPSTLIHGDLWSGNVHCDKYGKPALIDPAVYWGWAEAELSMTLLFGGFPDEFYNLYQQLTGVDKQWSERAPLYNLYHLLNHLLLFGRSYLSQVKSSIRMFI